MRYYLCAGEHHPNPCTGQLWKVDQAHTQKPLFLCEIAFQSMIRGYGEYMDIPSNFRYATELSNEEAVCIDVLDI